MNPPFLRRALAAGASIVAALTATGAASPASPVSLLVPQSTAFSILGHSCGGIQEQALATGFDAVSGLPEGGVYLQTRCGGSGRGGGYRVTTYSAWTTVVWTWSGAVSTYSLGAPAGLDPAFSTTDAAGDQLYNTLGAVNVLPSACSVGNTTYCTYRAWLVVVPPAAPTGVTASQVADQLQVSWTPAAATAAQVTSSTITATPVGSSSPVLTATVAGSATTGLVGPLSPSTTYQVTVVSTTAGGSSPAGGPFTITTVAASVVPNAPTGVSARWTAPGASNDTLVATWSAATGGDSPVDSYQVRIVGSDAGGTFTQTVGGSSQTATFAVSDVPDWTVSVRAHDAAGWSAWSAGYVLGGA